MTMLLSTRARIPSSLDSLRSAWSWRSKPCPIQTEFSKFSNLQAFYANNPSRFQGGIASTLTPRNLRQTLFGGYVQDDWRFKSNLTLNLGLRYEMVTVPTETAGKLAVLRNLSDATPHIGDPFFNNPTTKNFEPRIGFAWDPFRNGKMAVRGGFGMFDVLPLPYQFTLLTTLAAPFFQYTSINNPGVGTFPNNLPPLPSNKPAGHVYRSQSKTKLRNAVQPQYPVPTYA